MPLAIATPTGVGAHVHANALKGPVNKTQQDASVLPLDSVRDSVEHGVFYMGNPQSCCVANCDGSAHVRHVFLFVDHTLFGGVSSEPKQGVQTYVYRPNLRAHARKNCCRRVPKFWTYGSVCCACAQRPGLPCARVTPASSPASHCKQCSALTSPSLHARGSASPSRAR